MADPNYKVVYKTRPVEDRDTSSGRPRMPTALDTYEYPEDRAELKYGVAQAKIAADRRREAYKDYDEPLSRQRTTDHRDEYAATSESGAGSTVVKKTTYAVNSNGIARNPQRSSRSVILDPPPAIGFPPSARGSTIADRDNYDNRSRSYRQFEGDSYSRKEAPRSRYEIERPRREGGAYVVNTRGDDIDVIVGGGRDRDRGFGGYRNDPYSDAYDNRTFSARDSAYRRNDHDYDRYQEPRLTDRPIDRRGPYAGRAMLLDDMTYSGQRGRAMDPYNEQRTTIGRTEEDDWRMVEPVHSQRIAVDQPLMRERDDAIPSERGPRSRGQYLANPPSEDDYVMISPPRQTAPSLSAGTGLRSAMSNEDRYPPEERMRRRRSRSISFRDSDVTSHSVGERRHERPGAEAANCGRYLSHYDPPANADDQMDYEYRETTRRDTREADRYTGADNRYPPQRDRSRRRRRDDDDDESY